MPFGDLYEVVDESTFDGQKCLNVYFYQANNALASDLSAEGIATLFISEVLPAICGVQSGELTHTLVRSRNLFDETDSYEQAISITGDQADGEYLPIFNAFAFVLNHATGGIRSGAKRFTGVMEGAVNDGVITHAPTITALTALGTALAAPIDEGSFLNTWLPVVVKRILDAGEYRLPENLGEAVFGVITDAVWKVLITSQNSRKIGVGE